MLRPAIFTENLFDDWFDDFGFDREFRNLDRKLYGRHANREMLTDVRDHDDHYEVEIDLPGFKKDQITIELKNGFLTVTAAKGMDQEKTDKKGRTIRQERYAGTMQRSFWIGEETKAEEIGAKFEDGVLKLSVPKKDAQKALPEKTTVMIEG